MPDAPPDLHSYTIRGHVYESDRSTLVADATVLVENITSGGEETVTSNAWGEYLVDLANYTNGYAHADQIDISVIRDDDTASATVYVILE